MIINKTRLVPIRRTISARRKTLVKATIVVLCVLLIGVAFPQTKKGYSLKKIIAGSRKTTPLNFNPGKQESTKETTVLVKKASPKEKEQLKSKENSKFVSEEDKGEDDRLDKTNQKTEKSSKDSPNHSENKKEEEKKITQSALTPTPSPTPTTADEGIEGNRRSLPSSPGTTPSQTPTTIPTITPTPSPTPTQGVATESKSVYLSPNSSATPQGEGNLEITAIKYDHGYWDFVISGNFRFLQPQRIYQLWLCNVNCSSHSDAKFTTDNSGGASISSVTINHAQINDPVSYAAVWELPSSREITEDPTTCYMTSNNSPACLKGSLYF